MSGYVYLRVKIISRARKQPISLVGIVYTKQEDMRAGRKMYGIQLEVPNIYGRRGGVKGIT